MPEGRNLAGVLKGLFSWDLPGGRGQQDVCRGFHPFGSRTSRDEDAGQLSLSYDGSVLVPEFGFRHVHPCNGLQSSLWELSDSSLIFQCSQCV